MHDLNRQVKKEKTRGKIIDAAFKIYSENGFTAATSLIAKEAGIAHGSLFLHFPTRDCLIICLAEEFGNLLGSRFSELSDVHDTIEGLLGAHIDILSEYESLYSRFITEIVYLPEPVKAAFAEMQSGVAYHFNKALDAGIESGQLKRLPPHILYNAWIGLLHYYLQNGGLSGPVLKKYKKQLIFTYCELLRRQ